MSLDSKVYALYQILEGLSDDLNEIKEHLGLQVHDRTISQKQEAINVAVDKMISCGASPEAIQIEIKTREVSSGLKALKESLGV